MKKMLGDIILWYTDVYHKWTSYDIWFLKYKVQQTEVFVVLGHFLPFQPPNNQENQNFKIEKSTWRYYYFTHVHHKWKSYDVWFPRYGVNDGQNFLSFWTVFCPFTPLTTQKMKKTLGHTIILHKCTINEISSFYVCVPKIMIRWCTIRKKWCAMDGRTDGRNKRQIEVGAPPENMGQSLFNKHSKFQKFDEIFYSGMTRLRNTNLDVFMQCQYTRTILRKKNVGQSLIKKHSKFLDFDEIFYCGMTRQRNSILNYCVDMLKLLNQRKLLDKVFLRIIWSFKISIFTKVFYCNIAKRGHK